MNSLNDPAELNVLKAPSLTGTSTVQAFDHLTRLASRLLNAPRAIVSLVDDHHQFIKGTIDWSYPKEDQQEQPLKCSFCRHLVETGAPLIVNDARQSPRFHDNPAATELNMVAYLGMPLRNSSGQILGSFCVIDDRPRQWTPGEVGLLSELSEAVISEIELHGAILTEQNRSRVRLEQLEADLRHAQKLAAFGQLVSGLVHDFNNFLGIIQINAQLMREGRLKPQDLAGSTNAIHEAADRGVNLTRQLLDFTRKGAVQLVDLDLSAAVVNVTKMLGRILGRNLQLKFHPAGKPLLIHGDAGMLDQVIMNLVINARDAMSQGGDILIETAAMEFNGPGLPPERCGEFVRLTVSDSGCGIPPEILPHIFEPFFTTKGEGCGTGLGLSTVQGILKQLGGWVDIQSAVGQGTTVYLYFPCRKPDSRNLPHVDMEFFSGGEKCMSA